MDNAGKDMRNNGEWKDALFLFLRKLDYGRQEPLYGIRKYLSRLFYIKGSDREDPCPGKSARELAQLYVDAFHASHPSCNGIRTDYGEGETFHCGLDYDSQTLMPVLSATHCFSGGGYCVRLFYSRNGEYVIKGPAYPYSEVLVKGETPVDMCSEAVFCRYQHFYAAANEISRLIRQYNNS